MPDSPRRIGGAADHGGFELKSIWPRCCVRLTVTCSTLATASRSRMTIIPILLARRPRPGNFKKASPLCLVAIDGKPAGIVAVAGPIKSTTVEAIGELHALGLQIVMLTGGNCRTAHAVAEQLGLDEVAAEIEPAGKVA
jgi:cation transport ATPase